MADQISRILGHAALANSISRRELLKRSALLGVSVPIVASLLAACEEDDDGEVEAVDDEDVDEPAADPPDDDDEEEPEEELDDESDEEPVDDTDGEEPQYGGTLRIGIQNDLVSMWPAMSTGPTARKCYDNLLAWRPDEDGNWGVAPYLAESWEIDDDKMIFELREDVMFHDGTPLDAEAVAWNVEIWKNDPQSLMAQSVEAVDEDNPAEVLDEFTVQINTTSPAASLPSQVSDANYNSGIASPAAYEELGEDGLWNQAVGSGPFKFEDWQSGASLEVVRNEDYWRSDEQGNQLPYLDRIEYRFIPDDSVRLVEIRSDNIDFTDQVRGRDVGTVEEDPNLVVMETENGIPYRFFFNGQAGPFVDNLALRQAVQYGIDREAIAEALGGGRGIVLQYDLVIPGSLGYDESVPYYEYDPERAAELLEESGYDTSQPIRLVVISREADQQQAEMIQHQLGELGLQIEIEAVERAAWGDQVRRENDFEMATQRSSIPADVDPTWTLSWAPSGPAPYIRADEPEVMACLEEGRSIFDDDERHSVYVRCQELFHETAWWGVIWLLPWNYVWNERVKGVPDLWAEEWREEVLWFDD